MRFLLNSLLLALCISCTSYPKKNNFTPIESKTVSIQNPYFSDTSKDYIYKANIAAFDTNFSGIFIVKKLGPANHRIVFTTELGNKIFDFTFKRDDFKVNHILKELDKKLLITILRNDFKTLIAESIEIEKTFSFKEARIYQTKTLRKKHFYYTKLGQLRKIFKVKKGRSKVEFLFSQINNDFADYIEISHNNFNLKIELKAI